MTSYGPGIRSLLEPATELSDTELDHLHQLARLCAQLIHCAIDDAARHTRDPIELARYAAERARVRAFLVDQSQSIELARRWVGGYPEAIDRLAAAVGQGPSTSTVPDPDNPAGYLVLDHITQMVCRCPPNTVFDPEAIDLPIFGHGSCVPLDQYDPTAHPERYHPAALAKWTEHQGIP
ncbi:hypothetical protein DFR70_11964 [Nocardia tenerifensis]|uniref:Uncharacterized protein n=1 Tax=Nocardia tenerifensis TaxID=228006 RepID=A0A318JV58_9NOCA|nr:hypothetical protein [Nocardia tenerifensis]PXX56512.1 hypothetical protein DFR70_11964 [Nocardia tenerifensis]